MGCANTNSRQKQKSKTVMTSRGESLPILLTEEQIIVEPAVFIKKREGIIQEKYKFGEKLSITRCGTVKLGIHISTGEKRAIKIYKKPEFIKDIKKKIEFFNEIEALKNLSHPNIAKLLEFYEDTKYYYLVTEYVEGGELLDYLIISKSLNEPIIARFMQQIMFGIAYCHSKNIIHRNISPKSLLLDKFSQDSTLKLINFASSKSIESDATSSEAYARACYMAPEAFNKTYTDKCDI